MAEAVLCIETVKPCLKLSHQVSRSCARARNPSRQWSSSSNRNSNSNRNNNSNSNSNIKLSARLSPTPTSHPTAAA